MLDLDKHFTRIGARVRVHEPSIRRFARPPLRRDFNVDVLHDRDGEVFDITLPKDAEARVVNSDRDGRHLVLLVQLDGRKAKFLCGHDERHWFAAAIPEDAPVGTVDQAKRALQPVAVRAAAERLKKKKITRHNEAFIRQGEWFFMPSDVVPDPAVVLCNEPLTRGRGKPHMAQYLYRSGGETVYVGTTWNGGRGQRRALTQKDYDALPEKDRKGMWTVRRQNAAVFVKGFIRHPDHAAVELLGWYQVYPNTESNARAMAQLSFID